MQLPIKETTGAMSDNRYSLYKKLHEDFLEKEESFNRICAETVLQTLFVYFKPESVLDVGCGLGTWLSVAQLLDVQDIFGIEGPWLNKDQLRINPEAVTIKDLESPFDIERRFDLTICLEVAEHLSAGAAKHLVHSLVQHSDVVLFSAAIPYQGGHNHINEQWQPYWVNLFEKHNYRCFDFLQKQLWDNGQVFGHVRQNMLLFAAEAKSEDPRYKKLFNQPPARGPFALVHPETHKSNIHLMDQMMQIKQKYDAIMDLLMKGGTFISVPKDKENLELKRMASKPEILKNLNNMGVKYYQDLNYEGAEAQFQLAIEMDPNFAESYNNLAVLLWQKGFSDKAFDQVNEALRLDPDDPDTIINFANMCTSIGFPEKAQEAMSAYLKRHPDATEVEAFLTELEICE